MADDDNELLYRAIKAYLKKKGIVPPDNCTMVAEVVDGKIVDVTFVEDSPQRLQ